LHPPPAANDTHEYPITVLLSELASADCAKDAPFTETETGAEFAPKTTHPEALLGPCSPNVAAPVPTDELTMLAVL